MRTHFFSMLIVCFIVPQMVRAEAKTGLEGGKTELPVCSGYDPAEDRWGPWGEHPNEQGEDNCPAGQAFLAHAFVGGSAWREIVTFAISGSCCPVPRGVLLDRHLFVPTECPPDYIITGSRVVRQAAESGAAQRIEHLFRCTLIDRSRFSLGPPISGWEVGLSRGAFARLRQWLRFGRSSRATTRSRIPLALRYGLFRTGPYLWLDDGCVGHPWGSILTARKGKDCSEHIFRELLAAHPGPGQSAHVQVYPDCSAIAPPFGPDAECVP